MTATTVPQPAQPPQPSPGTPTAPAASIARSVLAMEWTKFRTVRSTYWTLLAAVVAAVGIAALTCSIYINRFDRLGFADRVTFNPTRFSLNGLELAQLAIGVLGVLVVTNEYSTGMIRATFAAVPQRLGVLAAKGVVFSATVLVLGELMSFAAFFLGQSILSSRNVEAHIGNPGVLRAVVGGGLYLTVLGLLALGLGTLIRHTAGAIAALFGLLLVLPGIVAALPPSWQDAIQKWLPINAGQAIFRNGREIGTLHQLAP
ncbi:MAG TPA: hypothetical protein VFH45_04120, partial [Acidimicrobiales bacterium]|nr:hypothetical protein [Acidimicrobiales bacterium]